MSTDAPLNTDTPAPRVTRQRTAIREALAISDEFVTAQHLHDRLKGMDAGIGLATVYRTLQQLTESGEVDCLRTDAGERAYRACSRGPHHHLVCRSCGRTVEVEGEGVEAWASRVAKENGFRDVSHDLELFGLCDRC